MSNRVVLLTVLSSLLLARPVAAQFTLQTFTPGTIIVAEDVNSNFSLLANALDRRGGTMTGGLIGTSGTFSGLLQGADLAATDDLTVGGAATITGLLTTAAQAVSGNITPGTTNTYDLGASAARWDTVFARLGNFSGAVTLASTLTVGGNTTIDGTLGVTGNLSNSGGDFTIADNLVITGTSDLQGAVADSGGVLTLADAVAITGTLDAQGALSNSTGSLTLDDAVALTGLLTSTAAGTNSFSATVDGNQTLLVRNSSTGTSATTQLQLGNSVAAAQTQLLQTSSGFTPSGSLFADGTRLTASGAGGLTFSAADTSGIIRFFTAGGGSALRWSVEADGDVVPGADATYDIGSSSAAVADIYTNRILIDTSGAIGVPTLTFDTDTNTGVEWGGGDTIRLVANGDGSGAGDGAFLQVATSAFAFNIGTDTVLSVLPTGLLIGADTQLAMSNKTTTPIASVSGEVHVYMRNGNIVFQYLDGATTRYKYLDLTGTGVTWVHSTVAP